jgi:hypothetical protein
MIFIFCAYNKLLGVYGLKFRFGIWLGFETYFKISCLDLRFGSKFKFGHELELWFGLESRVGIWI